MPALEWDKTGERLYQTGVNQVVVYPQNSSGAYPTGYPWNGVTAITESPSGAEPNPMYADNIKYLNLMSAEEFAATLEAYMFPDEFGPCIGIQTFKPGVNLGQQTHKPFGLSYVTQLGNDSEGDNHGTIVHLVYGCMAAPTERAYNTINNDPEAMTMSWEISTTPVDVPGFKPTSIITIDSVNADPDQFAALLTALHGGTNTVAHLPLPAELATIFTTVESEDP